MLQKFRIICLLIVCLGLLMSCKHTEKKRGKLTSYFNLTKDNSLATVKSEAMDEATAKADISSFFLNIKPGCPQAKCFVDIQNLQSLLEGLKDLGASGVRIYSAAYTARTVAEAHRLGMALVKENDYHYIIVPIDDDGDEIKSDDDKLSTIYNYNNDCPHSCPQDWKSITLIGEVNRTQCR